MEQPTEQAGCYYVTVRDGRRHGLLLGPYPTHQGAIAQVERGKLLALQANDYACFYAFGTARLPAGKTVKTLFGN